MNSIRIAVILMTMQRYLAIIVNFTMMIVVARLLRPEEVGTAVIGTAIVSTVFSLREFASINFLIQKTELRQNDKRVVFSVLLLTTFVSVSVLMIAAPFIAQSYDQPVLVSFLYIAAIGGLLDPIGIPILGLLQRDMLYKKVAVITSLQVISGAAVTISLAAAGYSSLSFAWGLLAGSLVAAASAIYFYRDFSIFRPVARGWRSMLVFSGYSGANMVLARAYEAVPSLFLGHVVSMNAVGIYNRAVAISDLPEKVLMSGLNWVVIPKFSAKRRENSSLKDPYLRGISYITALKSPALLVLAILAHPIVDILLGSKWVEVAPIIQIISLAYLFSPPLYLNLPVLVAMGAMRDLFIRGLIVWPVSTVVLSIGALYGPKAMAFGLFIAVPFQAYVGFMAIKKHITITWRELFTASKKGLIVTLITAAAPMAMVVSTGFRFELSLIEGIVAGCLAALCWFLGLWLTKHPFLEEVVNLIAMVDKNQFSQRLFKAFGK